MVWSRYVLRCDSSTAIDYPFRASCRDSADRRKPLSISVMHGQFQTPELEKNLDLSLANRASPHCLSRTEIRKDMLRRSRLLMNLEWIGTTSTFMARLSSSSFATTTGELRPKD